MIIEFKGMRPDVEKATFIEEELQRQKKNAAVYTDDADEYANNIKIIGQLVARQSPSPRVATKGFVWNGKGSAP